MNADELFTAVTTATDVLRVETLDAYDSDSDVDYVEKFLTGAPKPDPAEKATWLGFITAAAERGHPWRRLRVVTRPVSPYVRYACEWGYTDNVAAGEDVRVIEPVIWPRPGAYLLDAGDAYYVDGRKLSMFYDENGAFLRADEHRTAMTDQRVVEGWFRDVAVPFTEWWADNRSLHRDLSPV